MGEKLSELVQNSVQLVRTIFTAKKAAFETLSGVASPPRPRRAAANRSNGEAVSTKKGLTRVNTGLNPDGGIDNSWRVLHQLRILLYWIDNSQHFIRFKTIFHSIFRIIINVRKYIHSRTVVSFN